MRCVMGLSSRKFRNESLRANGVEPVPDWFAGVKRWMRYLKRVPAVAKKIKNPDKFLNAFARRAARG